VQELVDLVRQSKSGDTTAFAIIVHRFKAMVHATALSAVGDCHLAEDVTQDTFLQAWSRLPQLRDPAAFPGWLKRIVVSRANRTMRSRRKVIYRGAVPDIVALDASPSSMAMAGDVLTEINGLSDMQRQIVILCCLRDRPQREIAEFLGVPLTTVKKRLYDARRNLKKGLREMVEETVRTHGPGESFEKRVARVIEIFSSTGPEYDSTGSDWEQMLQGQTGELLQDEADGHRVAGIMAEADNWRVRSNAVIYYGLKADAHSRSELIRMFGDCNRRVRRQAVRFYAALIHPGITAGAVFEIAKAADSLPDGVDKMLPLLNDDNQKVRMVAVTAIGAYAGLDPQVDEVLTSVLNGGNHGMAHMTARLVKAECPCCGKVPEPFDHLE
jgi:RNA polymerase sigma factor (sigma-70 family)